MALVVETGVGLTGADSYASVEAADAYWLSMGGNAAWTAANTLSKEVALRRASEFVDIQFFTSLNRKRNTQGLIVPYADYAFSYLAWQIERAVILIAPAALAAPLLGNPVDTEPYVTEATDKVGELTKTRKYAAPVADNRLTIAGLDLDFIRALLGPLIGPTGGLVIGRRYRG